MEIKNFNMRIIGEKRPRQAHLSAAFGLCLSLLLTTPSLEAQSRKPSTLSQTKHAMMAASGESLQQISSSLEALAKRVSPSVVQIFSTGYNLDTDHEHTNTDLLSRGSSLASGLVIASDGWVVTNAHVVQGGRRIRVRLNQGVPLSRPQYRASKCALFDARLVVADRDTDLAVLKIEAAGLPTLELADSSDLKQGQLVLAFGSPLGLDNSVSLGIVSSVARQLDPDNPTIYIQTDAAVNPGNSGGPLVDTNGHVVGINTLILTQSGGNEGIGLAIPSNVVRSVYHDIRREGHVHHHEIGVSARTITPALALALGLDREDGVIIEDVNSDGPAASAGLLPGDVILSVDDKPVQNVRQFALSMYSFAVGDSAKLSILRDGRTISHQVAVAEKQDLQGRLADLVAKEQSKVPQLGILALTLDDNLRSVLPPLRKHAGVIVAGRESEGAYLGERLLPGDVIYAVSGMPVDSVDSLRSALEGVKSADAIALQVERLGTLHYLVLEADQ
jgi:serine protease Do